MFRYYVLLESIICNEGNFIVSMAFSGKSSVQMWDFSFCHNVVEAFSLLGYYSTHWRLFTKFPVKHACPKTWEHNTNVCCWMSEKREDLTFLDHYVKLLFHILLHSYLEDKHIRCDYHQHEHINPFLDLAYMCYCNSNGKLKRPSQLKPKNKFSYIFPVETEFH